MAVAARYVVRELALVFLVVVVVLLAVAVGGRFIGYLQDAALGKYAAASVITILWLRLPSFLTLVLPFASFLALLLTLGRLHAEQEYAALSIGGAGPVRLLAWLAAPVLAVASVVGYFSTVVAPRNDLALTEFLVRERSDQEFRSVSPGVFHDLGRGRRVTYAQALSDDRQVLEDVFLADFTSSAGRVVTVRAQEGRQYVDAYTGSRYLLLKNGTRYLGRIGERDYQVLEFDSLSQRLMVEEKVLSRVDVAARATRTLIATPSDNEAQAELHWRLALPTLVVVGSLLAVGLSRVKPRQGRFARLLPGFGVFVLYYALLVVNQNAILEGVWPAAAGLWIVHALFLLGAVLMLERASSPSKA